MPTDNKTRKKKRGAPKRYRCPVIRVTLCIPQDGKNELVQQAEKIASKYLRKGQQARPRVKGSSQGKVSKIGHIVSGQAIPPQAAGPAPVQDQIENPADIPLLPGANANPETRVLLPGDSKK